MSDQPFLFEGKPKGKAWQMFVPPSPYSQAHYIWRHAKTGELSPGFAHSQDSYAWLYDKLGDDFSLARLFKD